VATLGEEAVLLAATAVGVTGALMPISEGAVRQAPLWLPNWSVAEAPATPALAAVPGLTGKLLGSVKAVGTSLPEDEELLEDVCPEGPALTVATLSELVEGCPLGTEALKLAEADSWPCLHTSANFSAVIPRRRHAEAKRPKPFSGPGPVSSHHVA